MESLGLKIVQDGKFFCFDAKCKCGEPGLYVDVVTLAKEIDAAVKEATDEVMRQHAKLRTETWFMDGYNKGKAEAYEVAAKIAASYAGPQSNDALQIAEDIRARAEEEENRR